jgi:hypothetical protein
MNARHLVTEATLSQLNVPPGTAFDHRTAQVFRYRPPMHGEATMWK